MTRHATENRHPLEPLNEAVDHVRGPAAGRRRLPMPVLAARYAAQLGLDLARFNHGRAGAAVLDERIRRDIESGMTSGEVRGTPTLFIGGVVHRGGYDAAALMEALVR
jgi:glutaredoxin